MFWETEIKKIFSLGNFEHKFKIYKTVSMSELQAGDIIILDLPLENDLKNICNFCKDDAYIVLCSDFENLRKFKGELFDLFSDIWISPFNSNLIIFEFKKLFEIMKLKKDFKLNKTRLDTTINSIPDLVWFKDIRGSHLKVNDAFCSAVGKTKKEIEGRGHYYIWDIEREEYEKGEYVCLETEEIVIRERKTCLFDEMVKSKNGLRQFKTYKSPIFDDNNDVIETVGIAHDVTDLENIVTELEIILSSMPFAILVKDNHGTIVNANDKFETYFNINSKNLIGVNYDVWKNTAIKDISCVNAEGYAEATLYDNKVKKILEVQEVHIFDVFSDIVGQLCIYRDVTSERLLENQILNNSNTDFMTGLYNRRYFYEYINKNRLDSAINLIYIDLDYFKKVNDTFGHKAGDEGLIITSHVLKRCFPDAFIARLGGDEFLVTLLGEYSIQKLEELSEALLSEMHKTFRASEQLQILSASIGIAQTSDPNMQIDTLIRQSDIALYEAKQQGRARCCIYNEDMEKKK